MNPTDDELRGVSSVRIVRRKVDGSFECVDDALAVEEPLEIRIGQQPLAITMRTPGHDAELVAGFLLSEGIVHIRADVRDLSPCLLPESLGNVLRVTLAPGVKFEHGPPRRFGSISTSCGLCGKTSIADIRQRFPAIEQPGVQLKTSTLLTLPEALRQTQTNFARTGGLHAAGIFDLDGRLLVLREDVGRHNAVDKAVGRAFLDRRTPLKDHVLMVSGRASLEIVQKALAAGLATVASVSAPSTLAVQFARESGQTLIGFLRPPTFNVYSHIERLALDRG